MCQCNVGALFMCTLHEVFRPCSNMYEQKCIHAELSQITMDISNLSLSVWMVEDRGLHLFGLLCEVLFVLSVRISVSHAHRHRGQQASNILSPKTKTLVDFLRLYLLLLAVYVIMLSCDNQILYLEMVNIFLKPGYHNIVVTKCFSDCFEVIILGVVNEKVF